MKTKVNTDISQVDEVLNRGTIVNVLPSKKEFRERLLSGDRLRFYIGFDATAPTLHLSHAKNFILMEKFRKLGHEVIILFGDFTATIGDPTGESSTRKQLSHQEVKNNITNWKALVKPLMDFDNFVNPPKILKNSIWLSNLSLEKGLQLASSITVQQLIERKMFQKRLQNNTNIYLHEFLYPLLQGYDSVAMNVDVEVCGTDQTFNALIGRDLTKSLNQKEKYVVTVTLMENPKTGELMSKSKGTGIFLNTSPEEMFSAILEQPEEMLEILFVNNTLLTLNEISQILEQDDTKSIKKRLAYEITKIFHDEMLVQRISEQY